MVTTTEAQRSQWRERYHARQDRLHGPDRSRRRGRKPSLSPDQSTRMLALWEQGVAYRTIAAELGTTESTVRRTLHVLGYPKRRRDGSVTVTPLPRPRVALPWWEGGMAA